MPTTDAAIGFAAHLGWACYAAVTRDQVIATGRIDTAPSDSRVALEPYHVAGGFQGLERVPPPADPEAVVRDGLAEQRATTHNAIANILDGLAVVPTAGAVITARGRIAPTLEKTLASHAQIHIAEGNAVRESIRLSLEALAIQSTDIDGKTLAQELGKLTIAPPEQGPWRKEERLCALAALRALLS